METRTRLHSILRIEKGALDSLSLSMGKITGKQGVIEGLEEDIDRSINSRLKIFGLNRSSSSSQVVEALSAKIKEHEDELYSFLSLERDNFNFEKVASLARKITTKDRGLFLKKDKAEDILRKNPPQGVLDYLGHGSVEDLLVKEDIFEVFSSLRFVESDEWMHKAFDVAYSEFGPEDFEEREIELRVLPDKWFEVAKKFVTKKHHNVSHLKEFGVIFLNPINQTAPGALLRDFALFFHYFHEISFYSKLFALHINDEDFGERLKSFLRGDVPKKESVAPGEWLIVQRYLWKEDLKDPRLFLPRVNPESLHWRRGEEDIINFGRKNVDVGLDFWFNLDFVAGYFKGKDPGGDLVSFDLEDNAMTFADGAGNSPVWYHQQEALWNELFKRYVGKESMESLIVNNFTKGFIAI